MSAVLNDIMGVLHADAGLGLDIGVNLFIGPIRARSTQVPVNAVFVTSAGGPPPIRSMGQVSEVRTAIVSIQVRWATHAAGDAKVRAIQNALQGVAIAGYHDVSALESEPQLIGRDVEGMYLWLHNYQLIYSETD
jgi:hypothetical protein